MRALSDIPPALEEVWRRAVFDGTLILTFEDRFEAQSNRNDLYEFRRAYQSEGRDRVFAALIGMMKVSADPEDEAKLIIQAKRMNPRLRRLEEAITP